MTLDQIEKICDEQGFWVNRDDDMFGDNEPGWEVGQMSSCGEDWFETFEANDADTFIANLERRVENWDSEEEAMPYIEMRGQNGVPSSIRDLLDDADWKLEQLRDLLCAIQEAPDEEDELEESKDIKVESSEDTKEALDKFEDGLNDAIQTQKVVNAECKGEFFKDAKKIMRSKEKETLGENRKLQEDGNDEDNDIEAKLEQVIETWKGLSPMHERIIGEIVEDSEDYEGETKLERIKGRLTDISYGLVNGTVGSLIYYSDTVKFFEEYNDDIWDFIQDLVDNGVEPLEALKQHCDETEIIMCSDTVKNWVVWMVYEEVAYYFEDELEQL